MRATTHELGSLKPPLAVAATAVEGVIRPATSDDRATRSQLGASRATRRAVVIAPCQAYRPTGPR